MSDDLLLVPGHFRVAFSLCLKVSSSETLLCLHFHFHANQTDQGLVLTQRHKVQYLGNGIKSSGVRQSKIFESLLGIKGLKEIVF